MSGKENNGELREKVKTFAWDAAKMVVFGLLAGGASSFGSRMVDKPRLSQGSVVPLNRKTGS